MVLPTLEYSQAIDNDNRSNIINITNPIEEKITIMHGNGNIVGETTDKCCVFNTYNVYALTIDVSNKYQQLYFNGELLLEGNYTSDWSENAMLLYI